MTVHVEPGTVVLYTDVACGWATVQLHRFYAARAEAGLDEHVRVDHRLFLLEDVNSMPLPKGLVDAEIPTFTEMVPVFGFRAWRRDASQWPITTLLTNEAVHAAKAQSLAAAEELDMALRKALFARSRAVSMLHEILAVAEKCESVDADALAAALDDGRARGQMMRDYRGRDEAVQGSPHFFLADGSDVHNPGIEFHWEGGGEGQGDLVLDSDDPQAMALLVRRAVVR
ncbi:DsbA family protein [Pseudactinotalea sp. Z1732]|uniref:DsbA family protein n=1 Tax=Pseudactinotalea sp. Z1732 TaxID=3413026 RepID=UPI003C7E8F8B